MPTQTPGPILPSYESLNDVLAKATSWQYVCRAIALLIGGREEEYTHETSVALFVIKAWLSRQVSLSYAIKRAPAIFCSMILAEEANKGRQRKEFRYTFSLDLFNRTVDWPDLTQTVNAAFQRMNIIDFLLKITWRPYRYSTASEKNSFEIERLNELTRYRLRFGEAGYSFGVNDAAQLLGKMKDRLSWKSTTVKDVRKRWRDKEAFLLIGGMEEFADIVRFGDLPPHDLLLSIEAEAKNYPRNASYFANVKGIIAQLTPEVSKELDKDERWRKLDPKTIALAPFNVEERDKIKQLGITPTLRRSAEETKTARRQRPWSK